MASIPVNAARRGCGNLKKGGVYAGSDVSPFGTLLSWVPLLRPLDLCPAPRTTRTLTAECFEEEIHAANVVPPVPIPHTHVMVSHVGSDYTPATFALECALRGPSRRISPAEIPPDVSPPIPMVFTHGDAVISDPHGDDILDWYFTEVPALKHYRPLDFDYTWAREGFGWSIMSPWRPSHPHQHLYDFLDALASKRQLSAFLRKFEVKQEPGVFGGTWITHFFYVPEDDEPVPDELAAKGVLRAELFNGEAE